MAEHANGGGGGCLRITDSEKREHIVKLNGGGGGCIRVKSGEDEYVIPYDKQRDVTLQIEPQPHT
jgi:hypothetical protein